MKKFLILVMLLCLLCGCSSSVSNEEELSSFDKIIKEDNYIIVDVRTEEEYSDGHVVGAINIPYEEVANADLDKDKTIIVYCKSGGRSSIAYESLKELGYDVYNAGAFDTIDLEKE